MGVLALSGCVKSIERDFSSLHREEVFALQNLPCVTVSSSHLWQRGEHSFACSMGEFNEATYLIYQKDGQVTQTKLLWKEYVDGQFFRGDKDLVPEVIGKLSDEYAPNDRKTMLGMPNHLSPYTFYTKHLKIKHEVDVYRRVPRAYDLHQISFIK